MMGSKMKSGGLEVRCVIFVLKITELALALVSTSEQLNIRCDDDVDIKTHMTMTILR